MNGKLVVTIKGPADEKWQAPSLLVKAEQFAAENVELIDFSGSESPQQGKPGLLVKVYWTIAEQSAITLTSE